MNVDIYRNIKIEPLRRIPEPPMSVIEFKLMSRGAEIEDLPRIRKAMLKKFPNYLTELKEYNKKLESIIDHNISWSSLAIAFNQITFIGDGICPLERKEVTEDDHKKHGRVEWLLAIDFEFFEIDDSIKRRIHYIPIYESSIKRIRSFFKLENTQKGDDF